MLGLSVLFYGCLSSAYGWSVIHFDDPDLWTAGSGALSSYQVDHLYAEGGWLFSGGPALRQTNSLIGGEPGAQGMYAWRLRDEAETSWQAQWQGGALSAVRFEVRSWNAEDDFSWLARIYFGESKQHAEEWLIDRELVGAGVDWHVMEMTLDPVESAAGLRIEFVRLGGERLLVDNIGYVQVPEGAQWALWLGIGGLLVCILHRRRGGGR